MLERAREAPSPLDQPLVQLMEQLLSFHERQIGNLVDSVARGGGRAVAHRG